MSDTDKKDDDKKFNETLKRMLKTPPKPHDKKDDNVAKFASRSKGRKKNSRRSTE